MDNPLHKIFPEWKDGADLPNPPYASLHDEFDEEMERGHPGTVERRSSFRRDVRPDGNAGSAAGPLFLVDGLA